MLTLETPSFIFFYFLLNDIFFNCLLSAQLLVKKFNEDLNEDENSAALCII